MIHIEALDIDDAVIEKIEVRHHVSWYEVEEACFSNRRHVRRGREGLYEVWSRTDEGRYLLIVIAPKGNGVYVVVTARSMDDSEQRSYRKAKGMR